MSTIHITFGIIVLNGEPFTRYNLRALYPWAHQIIIVEGACPSAATVATPNGHSTDSTLEVIRNFQSEEDPDHKVILVTAEDEGHADGFWTEKDEMSRAYAVRATGNYLWQVDIDEFYTEEHMKTIVKTLEQERPDSISFHMIQFWGSLDSVMNGYSFLTGYNSFHRLFRWDSGYQYITHRPPTVHDANGVDLRSKHWIKSEEMRKKGIFLYHYSMLIPKQAREKCEYYSNIPWSDVFRSANRWYAESFMRIGHPFRVYIHPNLSWLEPHRGSTPLQVEKMYEAVKSGQFPGIEIRPVDDINKLLNRRLYRVSVVLLKVWLPAVKFKNGISQFVRRAVQGAGLLPHARVVKAKIRNLLSRQ